MTTARALVMAAIVAAGLLVIPAPAQAGRLSAPTRPSRVCPPEYWDHELGCTYWLPTRPPRR